MISYSRHEKYLSSCTGAFNTVLIQFDPGVKLALINETDRPLIAHQTAGSDSDAFRHFKGAKL